MASKWRAELEFMVQCTVCRDGSLRLGDAYELMSVLLNRPQVLRLHEAFRASVGAVSFDQLLQSRYNATTATPEGWNKNRSYLSRGHLNREFRSHRCPYILQFTELHLLCWFLWLVGQCCQHFSVGHKSSNTNAIPCGTISNLTQ